MNPRIAVLYRAVTWHTGKIWTISIDFVLATYTFRAFICWEGCVECRVFVYFAKITHFTNNRYEIEGIGDRRVSEWRTTCPEIDTVADIIWPSPHISKYLDNMLPAWFCIAICVVLSHVVLSRCHIHVCPWIYAINIDWLIDWFID
jgi:hypothetical protein